MHQRLRFHVVLLALRDYQPPAGVASVDKPISLGRLEQERAVGLGSLDADDPAEKRGKRSLLEGLERRGLVVLTERKGRISTHTCKRKEQGHLQTRPSPSNRPVPTDGARPPA